MPSGQNGQGQPPEMPGGSNSENGQPPEMPSDSNTQESSN
jgi:hypothetical protein